MVHLLGDPYVTCGLHRIGIPEGSKRLLAYIAIHRGPIERRQVAGTLWPLGSEARAAGNLRSALWRLNNMGIALLCADKHSMTLGNDVLVDVHIVTGWTSRLTVGSASDKDLDVIPWTFSQLELLPGWYDDWALLERERVAQRVLHALEAQSRRLIQQGRHAEAVEAALVATGADPLRESAQQCLIRAHLAAGNWITGRQCLRTYRSVLRREIGVEPSPALLALLNEDLPSYPARHLPGQPVGEHVSSADAGAIRN